MRRISSITLSCIFLLAIAFSTEQRAHAYANPGSSLVLFQGASSLVMGGMYFFRSKIMKWFRRSPETTTDQQENG